MPRIVDAPLGSAGVSALNGPVGLVSAPAAQAQAQEVPDDERATSATVAGTVAATVAGTVAGTGTGTGTGGHAG